MGWTLCSPLLIGLLVAAVASAEEGKVTRSRVVGRAEPVTFTDEALGRSPLVGLRLRVGVNEKDGCIQTLTPIYSGGVAGKPQGRATDAAEVEVVAKPGYAVSGVNTRAVTGDRLVAIQLTFARLAGGRLDLSDTYTSQWHGGKGDGRPEVMLGQDGKLIIGVVGRSSPRPPERGIVSNLGLIQLELPPLPEPPKPAAPPPTPTPEPKPGPAPGAAATQPGRDVSASPTPPAPRSPAQRRPAKIETATPTGSGNNKLFEAMRAPESMRERAPVFAGATDWTQMLQQVDIAQHGEPVEAFGRGSSGVTIREVPEATLTAPLDLQPPYELLARIIPRTASGTPGSVVALWLPVGDRRVAVTLDLEKGAGLAPLEGQPADRNGTLAPASLTADQPADIYARVTRSGDEASIAVGVNGVYIVRWTGPLDHLASSGDARFRITSTQTALWVYGVKWRAGAR